MNEIVEYQPSLGPLTGQILPLDEWDVRRAQKEGDVTPMVRVVTCDDPYEKEVFISLERTPIVLAEVRKALPKLRTGLGKKWRVRYVVIEARTPRRENPYNPKQILELAGVGILVRYVVGPVLKTGVADPVGAGLKKHVIRWLKRFDNSKK